MTPPEETRPVPEPHPPGDPAAADRAWQRALTMAQKLYEALEELEEAGGIRQVGALANAKSAAKALATLRAARAALDGPVRELGRRPGPRR